MNQSKSETNAWSARRPLIIGLIGVLILLAGFGTWSVATSIAGAVVASGRIEVDRNRQVVQHLDGGIVQEILVEEGDTVAEGAVLLRLDAKELRSQLVITEGQLFELMARRARLDAERDSAETVEFDTELHDLSEIRPEVADLMQGQVRLFQARKDSVAREIDQLEKRRTQIQDQITGVRAQQASRRTQLDLIEEELANQQSLLDRGLAQAGTVLNLRRTEADLQGSLGELIATEAQAEGRITEIDIEILKLGTQQREEAITRLRDLRYQELELAETRRALKDRLARLDITAPVSGIVYGLQVHTPRSVIRPADPVLYLVPQDRPLVIAAQVAPTDVDQIFVSQAVTLRFPALDQRSTPELFGSVKQVSADAFEDQASGLSYYRTEIELNPGQLETLPEGTVLIPGMPVEGYIRTADRTPLGYLVKPLADYFVRAFRES
ncbi:HlyD family type I secretion periplasmic adaptor subunit [Phaeobacter gallaeciensis]|uniref:Membrane fusion protein (MFP) family protein n=1 Tax=Phaeobacter gallaeciensis TaxID=60890 RepID=A0AAC9Z721_9RHOB|nr:HlyD family type I secretion periplasmic adaptor subunit [Phaeobacter gallaeciensis]AHD08289.1 type I secretion membrane fusion protein, HlyD family [Phaeobacter gallaeciensis DSM 26640]ATE91555.1 putative HlyD family secretion protein [Phaeobacter gallaeciensis]ATE95831.1 putative HlyD family secretion protein [Phaeobacter gallaeciensis]ATF00171.1 putative HlyD family secretion protein [Phaeobacter gallaeciensis]ATF04603.1 putative HlyD family secretion protein [Phaeobacter gallaeciensis]